MRSRVKIAGVLVALSVLGTMGCFRGYLTGAFPSAAAEAEDIKLPVPSTYSVRLVNVDFRPA
jgi:hypothetical protein